MSGILCVHIHSEDYAQSTSGLPASEQRFVPEVWIEPPESPNIDLSQTTPSGDACAAVRYIFVFS
jgi:hypothetical protein